MYETCLYRYPVERDREILQLRDCDSGKVNREALRDVRDRQHCARVKVTDHRHAKHLILGILIERRQIDTVE